MDTTTIAYLAVLGIVSFLLGKVLSPMLISILQFFTSKTKTTLDDRIFKETSGPIQSFFFIFIFWIGTHYLGVFSDAAQIIDSYTTSIIALLFTYLFVNMAKAIFEWYEEEGIKESGLKIDHSFLPLIRKVVQIIIVAIGTTISLSQIGFEVTALLAVTSVVGVVVGLAAQETLGNIFAGIALQLDRPYYYGDYLRLTTGELLRLKKIGIRTTRLTDTAGNTVLLTNSEFAKLRIVRMTKGAKIAALPIIFEAPCVIDPSALEAEIKSKVPLGQFGIDEIESIKITMSRIRAPGWYEANISIHTKEPEKLGLFTDFANRIILAKIEGMMKAQEEAKPAQKNRKR